MNEIKEYTLEILASKIMESAEEIAFKRNLSEKPTDLDIVIARDDIINLIVSVAKKTITRIDMEEKVKKFTGLRLEEKPIIQANTVVGFKKANRRDGHELR